jgi:hypothetical protein
VLFERADFRNEAKPTRSQKRSCRNFSFSLSLSRWERAGVGDHSRLFTIVITLRSYLRVLWIVATCQNTNVCEFAW